MAHFYSICLIVNLYSREQQKALKEAAEKAGKKGPMVGGGIKKSGKKWKWRSSNYIFECKKEKRLHSSFGDQLKTI